MNIGDTAILGGEHLNDALCYIGNKIVDNRQTLAKSVSNLPEIEHPIFNLPERIECRASLIGFFGESLYEEFDSVKQKVIDWSEETAKIALERNVSLSDSLRVAANLRTVIWDAFTPELNENKFDGITVTVVTKKVDTLIDIVFRTFGDVYQQNSTQLMNLAYSALEEQLVPVVPVINGIAVVPIIGEIDTRRAKLLMDTSLKEASRLKLKTVIIDLSGVLMVDTTVADRLFNIVSSLKLTGVEAIITGISPEIAQTIVRLRLEFNNIRTFSTLEQALLKLGVRRESGA